MIRIGAFSSAFKSSCALEPSPRGPGGVPRRLVVSRLLGTLALLSLLACSSETDGVAPDGGEGGAASGGSPAGDGGSSASGGAPPGGSGGATAGNGGAPTWPTGPLRPTRYTIPDPDIVAPPCPGGSGGTLTSHEVLLGQTHLTPPGWPFQTVSADRPLTIAVAAAGSGAAPAFLVKARLDGEELELCLRGPSTLPADRVDVEASTYRGVLPAAWVRAGLELEISFAGETELVTPTVRPPSWITLYNVDAELFGEGQNEGTSPAQWREFLARLPVSYLEVGHNPFGAWRPRHLLIGPRDDGSSPTGATVSHGALVVTENPRCTSADRSAGTCLPHSGYGTMSGVLSTLDTFREANGVSSSSTWYADLARNLGGGLAGGQRGTGDDTDLTMNHELGHAWGFPHWDSSHVAYPYEGVQRNRGGFGDRWALDQVTGLLLSPSCNGFERQSPMQRAGSCVPAGSWFDPFSDYESARLLRMTLGAATEVNGTVPYSGGTAGGASRPFTLPAEGGRWLQVWNQDGPGFRFQKYDEVTSAFVDFEPTEWNRVAQTEVPVTMFAGGVIRGGAVFFEEPVEYVGNVLEKIDPSDAEDYAVLWALRSSQFYWARDLHLRFTMDDGTVFYRVYGREAVLRADGDSARFAFNLPRSLGDRVTRCEVLSRPLGHYNAASRLSESDSADNFYDAAVVLATWER